MNKQISVEEFIGKIEKDDYDFKKLYDFDLKNLMYDYYKAYEDKHIETKDEESYKKVLEHALKVKNEMSNIIKWHLYKEDSYNGAQFDCDSSNGTCKLMTDIYDKLWRFSEKNNDSILKGFAAGFGSDTMNSYWTTFRKVLENSFKKGKFDEHNKNLLYEFVLIFGGIKAIKDDSRIFKLNEEMFEKYKIKDINLVNDYLTFYEDKIETHTKKDLFFYISYCKEPDSVKNLELERERLEWIIKNIDAITEIVKCYNKISLFAATTSMIGNMVLVPAGFNRYRYAKTKDYWDISLAFLKKHGYKEFDKVMFEQYINTFFLWDYVDNKYEVISLFSDKFKKNTVGNSDDSHSIPPIKGGAILPSENEIPIFLENVNWAIRRRGIFMVAMLKIATADMPKEKYDEDNWHVTDIYKEIFHFCSNTDSPFGGTDDAIDNILIKLEGFNSYKVLNENQKNKVKEILTTAKIQFKDKYE